MKLAPSGIGAEPKKLALLGALLVLGGGLYWTETRSDAPVSANVTAPAASPAAQPLPEQPAPDKQVTESAARAAETTGPAVQRKAPTGVGTGNDTWVPSLKAPEDLDVSKIDPRIRLDLLAKVRAVPLEGGASSLFEFSKAPEPPAPKVAAINPLAVPVPPPAVKPPPAPPKPAGPPPPPPIPFKYYGHSADTAAEGQLEGLFLEGDPTTGSIYYKREGDLIKDRYKIISIRLRSAVVEDTVSHNQETLKLLEEQQ